MMMMMMMMRKSFTSTFGTVRSVFKHVSALQGILNTHTKISNCFHILQTRLKDKEISK